MTTVLLAPDGIVLDFVPRLHDSVVMVRVGDEAVLYEQHSGALHQLDRIATLVCDCFDGQASVAAIVTDLADAFSVDPQVVEADVLEMVRGLGRCGILVGVAADEQTEDVDAGC